MKTKLVAIGNSQGIRIPKALVAQCRLSGELEIEVREGCLVIRPVDSPRSGWAEAAAEMTRVGDDALLDADQLPSTTWDETEWEW